MAVSLAEKNHIQAFNHINFNLYHYAGNNPVVYSDPDGNDITNNTDGYITARLEDSVRIVVNGKEKDIDTLIIAPHQTVKGAFDGVRDEDGNYYKVSAHAPFKVNFEVNDSGMKIKGFGSSIINWASDKYKELKNKNSVLSGFKPKGSEDAERLSDAWDERIKLDTYFADPEKDYTTDEQKALRRNLDSKQFEKGDDNEN